MEELTRRYTDQEVARILQRATEIEEQRPPEVAAAQGLTVAQLHEIGRDVGLTPELIDAAVRSVGTRGRPSLRSSLVSPLSAKLAWQVSQPMSRTGLDQLLRAVEDQTDLTGTVTEALGTVRWTSVPRGHKFERTVQVTVTPTDTDTRLQVVSRYPGGLRAILHLLPGMWGGMAGGVAAASAALGVAAGLGVVVGSIGLGMGIGRSIWQFLARRNRKQVERLARDLTEEAHRIGDGG
ncbi:MAG: hypothetical protein AB7L66_07595 [Gemmatimonadales bacterium]